MACYRRIRDLRTDADMTQREVAAKLYLHLTQYRRYESGESELPLDIAVQIACLFHVSLDYIAGVTDDKIGLTHSALSERETQLIKTFRALSQVDQGRVLERADVLLNKSAAF